MVADPINELIAVFERQTPIDALGALFDALDPEQSTVSLSETAIGIDI